MSEQTLPIDVPLPELADFCRRDQVRELSVFGSALRDDFRPDSDVDLLVEFEPGTRVTFVTLGLIEEELEALLRRRIDLIPKSGLKPLIRQAVIASARVL